MRTNPAARDQTRVIFLDDDSDLRDLVVELLRSFGVECEAVASFGELKELLARTPDFTLAILDVNLGAGRPSGIDAYRWLREGAFDGRIAFLTGHAYTDPLVARARGLANTIVLEKPITSTQLLELVATR